jgi:hypothetical protein
MDHPPIQENEKNAILMLKKIDRAEIEFWLEAIVDQDRDGAGEHGFLEELAGLVKCRDADNEPNGPIFSNSPHVLPKELGMTDTFLGEGEQDVSEVSGYCFQVFLPTGDGDDATSRRTDRVNIRAAWDFFIAYAWPIEAGVTGNRVFVIHPPGEPHFWANSDKTYSGRMNGPAWDAALRRTDSYPRRDIDEGGPGQTGMKGSQWTSLWDS